MKRPSNPTPGVVLDPTRETATPATLSIVGRARAGRPAAPSESPRREAALEPLPPGKVKPYTVEQYPSMPGTVLLVGYDGLGEVMLELRMPAHLVTLRTVGRLRLWMKENYAGPALTIC